ncbi:rod shape-determining protein RodA [Candidatus Kaiserbacteria bacterium]|nr:rod shape-determining protein RodA [Candidatus Kaiserbacteria bacterium]
MISKIKNGAGQGARMFAHVDWFLFAAAIMISMLGLVTMHSFPGENAFFERQLIWIAIAISVFFAASLLEYQFLRRTPVVIGLYSVVLLLLTLVFFFGSLVKGAQERFDLGLFFVQPSDPAKVGLIVLLSKYFSRRHIEIAHIRHILVSAAYAALAFLLVLFQPDFGSAVIIASVWLGMVLVAGISWKHLATLFVSVALLSGMFWQWGLQPYQKERVFAFLHPLSDLQGAGYNAYQAAIAVGSGELTGKGVGYGTQSKLQFLPEYETDFVFAAFAEEWGFFGVLLLFGLFAVVIVRILGHALRGSDNFHSLFASGIAVYILAQFIVHVGMNIGLLPITGTTLPFMSYGGSHLITEYAALGILMGMRRRARSSHQARDETELVGVV